MSTPAFRALRARFPRARIDAQVRAGLEPLLRGTPWIDRVRPLNSHRRGARAWLADVWALRADRYELGVCLPDSFSSAWLMRAGGVRRIVGYAGQGRSGLLDRAVPRPDVRFVPRERHVLGVVAALGADPGDTRLALFLEPGERRDVDRRLARSGVAGDARVVVLAPGASFGPSKHWPVESFARVGDALARDGCAVVVVGTRAEAAIVGKVVSGMRARAVAFAGSLDLAGLKALVDRARLVVCNDAGTRHIAAAFETPCLVMMGPTSLEKTACNLDHVEVFTADVSCRPCYERHCPIDHRCMRDIPVDAVVAAARRALDAPPLAGAGVPSSAAGAGPG